MTQLDIREYEDTSLQSVLLALCTEQRWNTGKRMPDNYVLVDTETLGFSFQNDRIVQVGVAVVENGRLSNRYWAGEPILTMTVRHDPKEFVGKEKAVEVHGITAERSAKEGLAPREVFSLIHDVWTDARSKGFKIVGHNCYRFDIPFLRKRYSNSAALFSDAIQRTLLTLVS